jgi:hypothetical protein
MRYLLQQYRTCHIIRLHRDVSLMVLPTMQMVPAFSSGAGRRNPGHLDRGFALKSVESRLAALPA